MLRVVHIIAQVQEMAADDLRSAIGVNAYNAIKALDPHPCFVALEVGEDGVSTGNIIGHGNVPKAWSVERIQELGERLQPSTIFSGPEVYEGHDETNSRRQGIGKVVAGFTKKVADKVKAFAVAYLYPGDPARQRVQSGELDTCSIEAELEFEKQPAGAWIVKKVLGLTGVALANSKEATPGFENATILATVQELEEGGSSSGRRDHVGAAKRIRATVAEYELKPDQVFSYDEMLASPVVRDAVKAEVQEMHDEMEAEHGQKLTDAEQRAESLGARVAELEAELAPVHESNQRDELRGLIKGSELPFDATKSQVAYLQERLPLSPEDLDGKTPEQKQALVDETVQKEQALLAEHNMQFGPGESVSTVRVERVSGGRPLPASEGQGLKSSNMDAASNPHIQAQLSGT